MKLIIIGVLALLGGYIAGRVLVYFSPSGREVRRLRAEVKRLAEIKRQLE